MIAPTVPRFAFQRVMIFAVACEFISDTFMIWMRSRSNSASAMILACASRAPSSSPSASARASAGGGAHRLGAGGKVPTAASADAVHGSCPNLPRN
jgi:hypothetical protein